MPNKMPPFMAASYNRKRCTEQPQVSGTHTRGLPGPEGIVWTVIDTDVDSWIARACAIAGRPLTGAEREAGGLPASPGVCG